MVKIAPLVSVIIPNYNHEKYLKQRLESIFHQEFQNFEIILLDDASTDNSKEILLSYKSHPKISYCILNKKNSGNTFRQWNKGISLAKGKYIWIAESDDFSDHKFLSNCVLHLNENVNIKLIFCQSNRVNEKGFKIGDWLDHTQNFKNKDVFFNDFIMKGNKFIEEFLIYKNVIPNASGVVFNRDRALELGGISTNSVLKYNADWLFYLQLISNHEVAFLNKPFNNFRFHSQSVISKAVSVENRISLIQIEIATRKRMLKFLKGKHLSNLNKIQEQNREIIKNLITEKRYILIYNRKILKNRILFLIHQFFYKFKKWIGN